jgi:hypothetical protein
MNNWHVFTFVELVWYLLPSPAHSISRLLAYQNWIIHLDSILIFGLENKSECRLDSNMQPSNVVPTASPGHDNVRFNWTNSPSLKRDGSSSNMHRCNLQYVSYLGAKPEILLSVSSWWHQFKLYLRPHQKKELSIVPARPYETHPTRNFYFFYL